jgi:hypothetical protein
VNDEEGKERIYLPVRIYKSEFPHETPSQDIYKSYFFQNMVGIRKITLGLSQPGSNTWHQVALGSLGFPGDL